MDLRFYAPNLRKLKKEHRMVTLYDPMMSDGGGIYSL